MNADAYIPEISAPSGAKAAANGRGAKSAAEPGFDAALDEARQTRGPESTITDPRDRGIVPGGRNGQPSRTRADGEPGPSESGGQPPETSAPAPETGGGLIPEQTQSPEPLTGGGLPPQQVSLNTTATGGGLPPSAVTPPQTGGGLPPSTATPPATGGGLPPSNVVPAPATGGAQPPQTGASTPPTGNAIPPQNGEAPDPAGGQASRPAGPAPVPGDAAGQINAAPDGNSAPQTAKSAPDGKSAAAPKPAAPVLQAGASASAPTSPPASAANGAGTAPAPGAQTPGVQTAPPAQAAAAPASQHTELAALLPQDGTRPRAILEKSAGLSRTASSSAPAQAGQSTAAMPTGQAAQTASGAGVQTQPAALPGTMREAGREPVQARTERADAPPPAEPVLAESEFEGELTLQRQNADLRGADAAARANTPNGPRLPAHTAPAMAAQIFRNFNQGQRQFEIRMDPPELGRVEVKLQLNSSDNRVHAVLTAERPETLASLQRSSHELERALAEAGLDLADSGLEFELSQGGDQSGEDFTGPGNGFAVYGDAPAPETITDPSAGPMTRLYGFALSASSGIDVRI